VSSHCGRRLIRLDDTGGDSNGARIDPVLQSRSEKKCYKCSVVIGYDHRANPTLTLSRPNSLPCGRPFLSFDNPVGSVSCRRGLCHDPTGYLSSPHYEGDTRNHGDSVAQSQTGCRIQSLLERCLSNTIAHGHAHCCVYSSKFRTLDRLCETTTTQRS
jgi:hypothetical protein